MFLAPFQIGNLFNILLPFQIKRNTLSKAFKTFQPFILGMMVFLERSFSKTFEIRNEYIVPVYFCLSQSEAMVVILDFARSLKVTTLLQDLV